MIIGYINNDKNNVPKNYVLQYIYINVNRMLSTAFIVPQYWKCPLFNHLKIKKTTAINILNGMW